MENYEEKMLVWLAETYRKSKKDSGTNVKSRRTQMKPTRLYRDYNQNSGDMERIEAINQAAFLCREKGFLTFDMNGFSNEIKTIYLIDEKIEAVEQYLAERYQYEPKYIKRQHVENMLVRYGGKSPVAEEECEKLRRVLARNQIPKNYGQTEEILKALVFVETNQREMYLREASMMIYGDSKYFENNTLDSVCRLLRAYHNHPCVEDEMPDEILKEYHIEKEKQKLCLKGNITIWMDGKALDLGAFESGVEFFTDALERLERIEIRTKGFMTVENRTSYLRSTGTEVSFFYLGGYATRFQRDFLKKIFQDNPTIRYLHFGDIDVGGFCIHEHLCRVTGIPFELYKMSAAQLRDERFRRCLHQLSEHDRNRLISLAGEEKYRETAEYMLKENVKLEQEIVSYYEEF